MINNLCGAHPAINLRRPRHHPNGWTPERRARQSALIARWQPWRRATGPRTETGKARSSANSFKHGFKGGAHLENVRRRREKRREIRRFLGIAAHNIRIARALLRAGAEGRPDAIGPYVRALSAYMIRDHVIDGRR
jgi:hypothetical protein